MHRLENIPDVVESGKYSSSTSGKAYIYIYIVPSIFRSSFPEKIHDELKLLYFLSFLSFLNFLGLDLILDERNGRFGESESY